jgi:hypothetical protein
MTSSLNVRRGKMSFEKFKEIMREYDFDDDEIQTLWDTRPEDDLDEDALREAAPYMREEIRKPFFGPPTTYNSNDINWLE